MISEVKAGRIDYLERCFANTMIPLGYNPSFRPMCMYREFRILIIDLASSALVEVLLTTMFLLVLFKV